MLGPALGRYDMSLVLGKGPLEYCAQTSYRIKAVIMD
jgi:hypothetical protein